MYVLIFFSVASKYSVDEPIIYKLSDFRKTQAMKNQHALLKIKKTLLLCKKLNIVIRCHALDPSDFMAILISKAQGNPIFTEHIVTM